MHILFLTKYTIRGASSRYRVFQYLPWLRSHGFRCDVESLHTDEYLDHIYGDRSLSRFYYVRCFFRRLMSLMNSYRYSIIFIQKELIPYFPPFFEFFLRFVPAKIVYDLDDAIYLFYVDSKNWVTKLTLAGKLPLVISWSDMVLAGNSFLEDYARKFNSSTVYFPTVLDMSRYKNIWPSEEYRENTKPIIGWIGTPKTVCFLNEKIDLLKRVASRESFKLLVIGVPEYRVCSFDIEAVEWKEETEREMIGRCSIGIMPLSDSDWARGKCGLKLLQYMAIGLPVVSSPYGGAEDIIEDGSDGFIATTDDQWVDRLLFLLRNRGRRVEMGREGKRKVEEKFSFDIWKLRMAMLFKMVVEEDRTGNIRW